MPRRTNAPEPAPEAAPAKGQIRQANEIAILAAAERVFARTGFAGATMAEIATEAALPKPNLHYYFGNKGDLYRAVLARTLHEWLVPADGITAANTPKMGYLEPAAYQRTVKVLLGGGSSPVIKKDPGPAAVSHVVWDASAK